MRDDRGIEFKYTNRRYLKEIKREEYKNELNKRKKKDGITKIEEENTKSENKMNSKTCIYNEFKNYIKRKNEMNDNLLKKYENEIYRKYKWYAYINKKKSETKLIKEIKEKFETDSIICYGDWSIGKQMRNFISTPNLRLKKIIKKEYKTYSIDEYNTSKINYKTEEENENIYLPDKTGKSRKIHSILTYKTENKRMGCINRDNNSVRNMKKITEYFLEHKTRPEKYKRGTKKETKRVGPKKKSNSLKPPVGTNGI